MMAGKKDKPAGIVDAPPFAQSIFQALAMASSSSATINTEQTTDFSVQSRGEVHIPVVMMSRSDAQELRTIFAALNEQSESVVQDSAIDSAADADEVSITRNTNRVASGEGAFHMGLDHPARVQVEASSVPMSIDTEFMGFDEFPKVIIFSISSHFSYRRFVKLRVTDNLITFIGDSDWGVVLTSANGKFTYIMTKSILELSLHLYCRKRVAVVCRKQRNDDEPLCGQLGRVFSAIRSSSK